MGDLVEKSASCGVFAMHELILAYAVPGPLGLCLPCHVEWHAISCALQIDLDVGYRCWTSTSWGWVTASL